jgi:hypothetical protein
MEPIELNPNRLSLVAPKDGYILMVRFKLQDRSEFETLFCDYGMFLERALQLIGCRCKTFVVGQMPCDHAIKVGGIALALEHIVDVFQLPTPPWYYRLEEDARMLTDAEHLVLDVGVLDIFSEMTGTKT